MTDQAKPPSEVDVPPPFAGKAKDLEALRAAVVDSASVGASLWLSYLFVLLYFAIAVGGVTHRDLLLESPVKLPFLNVELPLTAFLWLGPGLFLIVHAYVLLQCALVADKVGAFDAELETQITDADTKLRLRRQLPINVFVQVLAGPGNTRTGPIGFLLALIPQITLVAAPLALLIFFQLQFLPYHFPWLQRVAIVADLLLLWILWPPIARGELRVLGWRELRRPKVAGWALASLAPLLLVFTVATFPGERLDTLPSVRFIPTQWTLWQPKTLQALQTPTGWTSLHELLVAGEVDRIAGRSSSPWSNRLILPKIDVIDHAKFNTEAQIAAASETLSLRGRRLEEAVLTEAVLRKVDFTGAKLTGGDLAGADLRQAKLGCGVTATSQPDCADLRGATLDFAQMQGASLDGALLQGAWLTHAQLQGVTLSSAQLQGARLEHAQLPGAFLSFVQAEGASFSQAQLQAADLSYAWLQGATLDDAQLQGATLRTAGLDQAQLQGATLKPPGLEGARLQRALVWRSDPRAVRNPAVQVIEPVTSPISATAFEALKSSISGAVRDDNFGKGVRDRIASLDPNTPFPNEDEMAQAWKEWPKPDHGDVVFQNTRLEALRYAFCLSGGGPWVIHGLVSRSPEDAVDRLRSIGGEAPNLLDILLARQDCPAAREISERDKEALTMLQKVFSHPPGGANGHRGGK